MAMSLLSCSLTKDISSSRQVIEWNAPGFWGSIAGMEIDSTHGRYRIRLRSLVDSTEIYTMAEVDTGCVTIYAIPDLYYFEIQSISAAGESKWISSKDAALPFTIKLSEIIVKRGRK